MKIEGFRARENADYYFVMVINMEKEHYILMRNKGNSDCPLQDFDESTLRNY